MNLIITISKMRVSATSPISYSFDFNKEHINLNHYLGKTLCLQFTHKINCIACTKTVKKSYQNGYCFPCTIKLAQCDLCILKPERCHFHLGTCREPSWGQTHCMTPHVVYLANSSGVKVGITRKSQLPVRWIDQGAIAALPLYEVPNRRISGYVEVLLGKYLKDKTDWRKMLSTNDASIDLLYERNKLLPKISKDLKALNDEFNTEIKLIDDNNVTTFLYPILAYPLKVNALSLDKIPRIEGTLQGIKGQYLILDKGVINMRKHTGYEVELKLGL